MDKFVETFDRQPCMVFTSEVDLNCSGITVPGHVNQIATRNVLPSLFFDSCSTTIKLGSFGRSRNVGRSAPVSQDGYRLVAFPTKAIVLPTALFTLYNSSSV